MLTIATKVAESSVHGLGLFSAESVPTGAVVWRFDARVDMRFGPDETVPAHWKSYVWRDSQSAGLDGDNARFMNHSDSPNVDARGDLLYALRPIAIGEEITINYSTPEAQCRMDW